MHSFYYLSQFELDDQLLASANIRIDVEFRSCNPLCKTPGVRHVSNSEFFKFKKGNSVPRILYNTASRVWIAICNQLINISTVKHMNIHTGRINKDYK